MEKENILDLSLKMLTGQSIEVEGFGYIEPLKLKEIIDYGYSKYMDALNIMTLTKESLISSVLKDVDSSEFERVSDLEILIYLATDEVVELIEESYKFFFRSLEANIDKDEFCIHIKYSDDDFRVIDKYNHHEILRVLKLQNYVVGIEDELQEDSNESEATKNFRKKMKKLQEEVEKAKMKKEESGNDNESPSIYDIISSVSTKSNINDFEIINLTVYQIYTKFKRLEAISQYDLNIQSILAGAKDIKLKHWSTKIG